jgi:chemotaxis protein MotB
MRRPKKKVDDSAPPGAPQWMVTFSDCMTLLLTFFVLLLSFAGFADNTLEGIGSSFANALPSLAMSFTDEQESMWERKQIRKKEKIKEGSETPTLEPNEGSNFMRERKPLDFRNLRVFTTPSKAFFYGDGDVISQEGKEVLDQLAKFLLAMPTRIVISENGPGDDQNAGLERAWTVLEYLDSKEGLRRELFSVTASTTVLGKRPKHRMLEITLLERDVFE